MEPAAGWLLFVADNLSRSGCEGASQVQISAWHSYELCGCVCYFCVDIPSELVDIGVSFESVLRVVLIRGQNAFERGRSPCPVGRCASNSGEAAAKLG